MLTFIAMAAALGLLTGMLAMHEAGRRIGIARQRRGIREDGAAVSAVAAAVFGLPGLLLAFTFSGAAARFEARRHLITTEANAIGTAYLRLDVLPADAQPALRSRFRDYLERRIEAHRHDGDAVAVAQVAADTASLQRRIGEAAIGASGRPDMPPSARQQLLPALNEMIDITTTRAAAIDNHPPVVTLVLLVGLCLLGALIVGDAAASGPRRGLIRVDAADTVLSDLRSLIHAG